MGSSLGGAFSTFYLLFVVGLLFFVVYFVTRFIGTKYQKSLRGKNINVIESVSIGIDKTLYLVRIGEQFFLLSSSGKNINTLGEVDASNIVTMEQFANGEENQQLINLKDIKLDNFTKYLNMFKKVVNKNTTLEEDYVEEPVVEKSIKTKKAEKNQVVQDVEKVNKEKVEQNVEKIKSLFNK